MNYRIYKNLRSQRRSKDIFQRRIKSGDFRVNLVTFSEELSERNEGKPVRSWVRWCVGSLIRKFRVRLMLRGLNFFEGVTHVGSYEPETAVCEDL